MIINLKTAKVLSIVLEASSAARQRRDPTTDELRLPRCPPLAQPGPAGMSAFVRYLGDKWTSSASSDRLGLLGIPVHPASLIRLAGATFLILASSRYGRSRRR